MMADFQQGDFSQESIERLNLTDEVTPQAVLPWDRFSKWIHCICIVTFDLEVGQAIELVYPRHVTLSELERSNICYLAFPDSNSGCMGDTTYHFRIRQCLKTRPVESELSQQYNVHAPVALQIEKGHYFGYVYFRQTKDKSIRRGYFQKSVVVLSKLPFVNLFAKIVNVIAPEFFENGEPGLEAACHDMDQWPIPMAGEDLNLPLMGTVIQLRIPCCTDKLTGTHASPRLEPELQNMVHNVLSSVHEVSIFQVFEPILAHIQLLWELVLTGESLVVMSSSPSQCSHAVQALVGMIWPLKYNTDYRPFFTIHDSEFKEYTTKTQAPPPVILGVTNPFFAKTLQHWPHIVRLVDSSEQNRSVKVKKAGNLKTLDSKPGVYTTYKSFLNKDKSILKTLAQGTQSNRPVEVQNALLKRFLVELTHGFAIPLERYVSSLMPLQKNISPCKGTPVLGAFNTDDFLQTLDASGAQLMTGVKGDWHGLYRKFCQSANFQGWYNQRRLEVNSKLQELHMQTLCDMDWPKWTAGRQEVEIVDLIIRMKEKLEFLSTSPVPIEGSYEMQLKAHIHSIVSQLPHDLQGVLHSSTTTPT